MQSAFWPPILVPTMLILPRDSPNIYGEPSILFALDDEP